LASISLTFGVTDDPSCAPGGCCCAHHDRAVHQHPPGVRSQIAAVAALLPTSSLRSAFMLVGREVNLVTVVALLTILGYPSTIIIFDRI